MSPFERARYEANQARVKLLDAAAHVPVHAQKVFGTFEDIYNLAIERVPFTSFSLHGGLACLNKKDRFIYLCDELNDEEFAEYLAHELGHYILDPQAAGPTLASIKSTKESHGSPALAKVQAYGARERIELLANVFARELLLPRALARSMFLAGKGPQEIADKVGVSVRLARLQLTDAVLLPQVPPPPLQSPPPPSAEQLKAAHAEERFVNVVAGPGTGKTAALVERVRHLVDEKGVKPAHILVLTFTNKAAWELVERLRLSGIAAAPEIYAGTFHAFGLDFLRKFHDAFGLDNDFIVADNLTSSLILEKLLPDLGKLKLYLRVRDSWEWLGTAVKAINRLKEELISPAEYRRRIAATPAAIDYYQHEQKDIATLYEAYEARLRVDGLVDFIDLIAKPTLAIRSDPARYSSVAQQYQYILVDEYQDVSHAMVELLRALVGKTGRSLWVVGDIRQAIHHWKGASIDSLMKFDEKYQEDAKSSGGKIQRYPLTVNYRSSQEIVDVVVRCGQAHVLQSRLPLDVTNSYSGKTGQMPIVVATTPNTIMPKAVADQVQRLHADGVPLAEQVILARKRTVLDDIARSLSEQGMSSLYVGEMLDRPEIKPIICLMQLLVMNQPDAMFGLNTFYNLGLTEDQLGRLINESQTNRLYKRGRWIDAPPLTLPEWLRPTRDKLHALIREYAFSSSPWEFACLLILERRQGVPSPDDISVDAHLRRLSLWNFLNSLHTGDDDGKRPSLTRFLLRQRMRQRAGQSLSDRDLPPEANAIEAPRLMTVHMSKGLEFQAVHLAAANSQVFDIPNRFGGNSGSIDHLITPDVLGVSLRDFEFEQLVERNNLLYVAVSRAKKYLRLYPTRNPLPPPFLRAPKVHIEENFRSPAPKRKKSAAKLAELEPISFEAFQTYVQCPLRYYYRFEQELRDDNTLTTTSRAQRAILSALRSSVTDLALPAETALAAAWKAFSLPAEEDDPGLWSDGLLVVEHDSQMLRGHKAKIVNVASTLSGLRVDMPPLTVQTSDGAIVLVTTDGDDLDALLKPFLGGFKNSLTGRIFHVLEGRMTDKVSSTKTGTKAVNAASALRAGVRSPSPGRHCKECCYRSVCPSRPLL